MPSSQKWKIVRPPLHQNFQVPTRRELLGVVRGDSVKLIFEDDEGSGERMWVTVTHCSNMEQWEGELDNDPLGVYTSPRLKYKTKLKFHPYNVIDILHEQEEDDVPPKPEQISLSSPENRTSIPWYTQPQYLVPIGVGLLGALTTIVAAFISN